MYNGYFKMLYTKIELTETAIEVVNQYLVNLLLVNLCYLYLNNIRFTNDLRAVTVSQCGRSY